MTITFKFLGSFRRVINKSKINLENECFITITLREAIQKIVEIFPSLRSMLIDPELNDPRPNSLILVNGKEISVLKGLDTQLKDGDEVVLVPVVHGG